MHAFEANHLDFSILNTDASVHLTTRSWSAQIIFHMTRMKGALQEYTWKINLGKKRSSKVKCVSVANKQHQTKISWK